MVATARAAVCLTLCLIVSQVRGAYVTEKMNKTIHNLLQHYKIPWAQRYDGKRVFSKDPLAGNMAAKAVLLGGVLETYEKLIGHMLNQLPTPTAGSDQDVTAELSYILKMVQQLRKHDYQEQEKLMQELRALEDIQMDNPVVQSKALWELPWLYEEASSIKMARRRRRQTRRFKTRPRA